MSRPVLCAFTRGVFMSLKLKRLLIFGVAVSALSSAQAQEGGPGSQGSLETLKDNVDGVDVIIVTAPNYVPFGSESANKANIPLIATPQSVSVVTRDQIDYLAVVDVQEAIRYSSGIVGENYGPDLRFDFLTVRGFTPKQYIDGLQAPITTTIFNVGADIYGFESVDILKGPSSVLYGNVPPGGIYNLRSRRADDEFGGEVSFKYGTNDFFQGAGTITGPLADGLSARLTGMYRNRESQVNFVDAERIYLAPTFTWEIGPSTTFTGLGYYQRDEVNGDTNGFLPSEGTRFDNPLGVVPISTNLGEPDYNRYERDQYAIGYNLVHEFSESVKFEQNFRWNDYDEYQQVIYGAGLLDGDFDGVPDDYRTVNRYSFPFAEKVSGLAVDSRVAIEAATGNLEHNIIVGVDYRNLANDATFGFAVANSIDLFDPVYGAGPFVTPALSSTFNDQRVKQTGVYIQDQISYGGLALTLGGRHDWVNLHDRAADATTKQEKFTYRVGLNYVFDNGIAPYVSYSTAFEPVLGTDSMTLMPFEPSTARQIEGGVKYDGRTLNDDVKIFATAAYFNIRQKNLVATQNGLTPVFGMQIGEVEAQGAEAEVTARVRDQLTINASYSYTDTEVLESANGDLGDPLPTTPKHKAAALIDYTLQRGLLGGLGAGIGVRHLSSSAGSLVGAFNPVVIYSEPTTLVDAIVHYDLPRWRVAVNASNLLDKKYVGRCSSPTNCIYGQSRQIIGTVTLKF